MEKVVRAHGRGRVRLYRWDSLRMEEIGRRIRQKRRALGWTLADLADCTAISARTLIKVEAGEDVRFSTLCIVLTALGMSLDFRAATKLDIEAMDNGTFGDESDVWY